jgi:hypothetical protein
VIILSHYTLTSIWNVVCVSAVTDMTTVLSFDFVCDIFDVDRIHIVTTVRSHFTRILNSAV